MRINKYLAEKTGISRREADILIEKGLVLINKVPARIGQPVSEEDSIIVNGNTLSSQQSEYIYLLVNKPVGYVCSKAQQDAAPTIYTLLPPKYQKLKTAGRLDKDSSGLVILTNDGDFAFQLTHPRFKKEKIYTVTLKTVLSNNEIRHLNKGVQLEDGISHLHITPTHTKKIYTVAMSEGRNRQIRRTFSALGHTVIALHRIKMGPYTIHSLAPGEYTQIAKNKQ